MRYKAGDKVRVRDWDDMVKEFGICGGNITIPGCVHWECPYKHCVYHEFYDPDRESIIDTPTTIRELDACMNWLDISGERIND